MMRSLICPIVVLLVSMGLIACEVTSEDSTCIENSTVECACAGGTTGMQSCTAAGIYSPCDCGKEGCTEGATQDCLCAKDQAGTQTCDANGIWLACTCESACTEGDTRACTCPNGLASTQTCDANGSFGACACSPNCEPGYQVQGNHCVDINECAEDTDNCHANATCENTEGGFTCTCDQYHVGDGVDCDFDECAAGYDNCDSNANCVNNATGFLCVCKDGFEGNGVSCSDINECEAIPGPCPEHAQCQNETGTFWCECDGGFEWNIDSCTNIDECARDLDDCGAFARCEDTEGSFTCACLEDYLGDGYVCTPDPDTYVANVSDRPVRIELEGIGSFDVRFLSRVGMDIEVIETPTTPGNTHKEPGLVTYPDITMHNLAGTQNAANSLAAWIDQGADADTRVMSMFLEGLGGEQLKLNIFGLKPVEGISTVWQEGENYLVRSITMTITVPPHQGIDLAEYYQPHSGYPDCPLPGWSIDIDGVENDSCWTLDGLHIPTVGSSEPVYLENVRNASTLHYWIRQTAWNWIDNGVIDRLTGSLIEKNENDFEIWQLNFYEAWPARINYFNPAKDYGYTYLVDLLIVDDFTQEAN